MSHQYLCVSCYGGQVNPERAKALIANGSPITCIECGDKQAKKRRHCIVPMAKSNYVVVTDKTLLKGLNKYANTE